MAVVGVFVWRGRVSSAWGKNGLQQGVFDLMVNMKGSQNRVLLLKELSMPKDRLQIAKDLALDWKTVNYHVKVLLKYGLIGEEQVYGKVKLYQLTEVGKVLLNVLEELNVKEAADSRRIP